MQKEFKLRNKFMLKNLTIVLIIVLLGAIGLNWDILASNMPHSVEKKPIETVETVKHPMKIDEHLQEPVPIKRPPTLINQQEENNLTTEIQALIKEANLLFQKSKDDEAMALYYQIVKKTKNSKDPKILKEFVQAYLQIAFLYKIYPNSDNDASIEAYDMIINKFKDSNNTELLGAYINAKIQKSYLLSNEERLETYDELIKKFENHPNKELQKKVEELLITKSFDLMGKNDEEAMQILDTLIDKYKNKQGTPLPEEIELAILNNLELAIITNNDDDKYRDLANEYLSDSPDTKPLLDMLNIIKNAQDLNQDEALEEWKKRHKEYRFRDWSFQELRRWINKVEDKETQERVIKYIDAFENHKYNINPETKLPYANQNSEKSTPLLPPNKYIISQEEREKYEIEEDVDSLIINIKEPEEALY